MLFRTKACLLLALASVVTTARAGSVVEIPRLTDGTLDSTPTPAAVTALMTTARWRCLTDKQTSTWESKTYSFAATGSVDIMTMYAWGPRTDKVAWHVVRATPPAIDIGGVEYAIAPCKRSPRTSCLVGPPP